MPRVHRDRAQLDRVEQREQVAANVARLFVSIIGHDLLHPHSWWRRVRRFLLIEAFAVDPVGEPLQDERAIEDRGQDVVGDAHIVTHDIAFGELLLGEEHLVEVRDLEAFAASKVESGVTAFLFDVGELRNDEIGVEAGLGLSRAWGSRRAQLLWSGLGASSRGDAQSLLLFLHRSFARHFLLHARLFDPDFPRVLVVADAEEDRLAETSVSSPFAELHLDDDFRLNPMGFLIRPRCLDEGRCFPFERFELAIHLLQSLPRESATGVADVDEAILVEVSEQNCADVLTTVARLGIATDDELLAEFDLQFQPVARAIARLVPGIDAFADDAFPTLTPRLIEHFLAIAFDRFCKPQPFRFSLSDPLDQSCAALRPRLSQQDLVAVHQDVEENQCGRRSRAMTLDDV